MSTDTAVPDTTVPTEIAPEAIPAEPVPADAAVPAEVLPADDPADGPAEDPADAVEAASEEAPADAVEEESEEAPADAVEEDPAEESDEEYWKAHPTKLDIFLAGITTRFFDALCTEEHAYTYGDRSVQLAECTELARHASADAQKNLVYAKASMAVIVGILAGLAAQAIAMWPDPGQNPVLLAIHIQSTATAYGCIGAGLILLCAIATGAYAAHIRMTMLARTAAVAVAQLGALGTAGRKNDPACLIVAGMRAVALDDSP